MIHVTGQGSRTGEGDAGEGALPARTRALGRGGYSRIVEPAHGSARLEPWVPDGRTLHLIDLENLAGGHLSAAGLRQASELYQDTVGIGPYDHVIVAVQPSIAFTARALFPDANVIPATGVDGADLALIDYVSDVRWIACRYIRIVLGSGDHIFAPVVDNYRKAGLDVEVVALRGSIANVLWSLATEVVSCASPPRPTPATFPRPLRKPSISQSSGVGPVLCGGPSSVSTKGDRAARNRGDSDAASSRAHPKGLGLAG